MKFRGLAAMSTAFVIFIAGFLFQSNAHADVLTPSLPGLQPGIDDAIGIAPGETPAPSGSVILACRSGKPNPH